MAVWNSFEIGKSLHNPAVADGSGIAAVSRIRMSMEILWIAADGSVQNNNFYDGKGLQPFQDCPGIWRSGGLTLQAQSKEPSSTTILATGTDTSSHQTEAQHQDRRFALSLDFQTL